MSDLVGSVTIAVRGQGLLVVATVKISGPAPFLGTKDDGIGIDGFDLRGVIDDFVTNFIHRRAGGMNVSMCGLPEAWLIIENVVAETAIRRCVPGVGQMLHPALLEC